ncbi:MAG: phosphotransferase [Gemmatimonadota bacterium]
MNRALRVLLDGLAEDPDPRLRRAWSSVIMHRNVGAIPVSELPAGEFNWNRGFDLLLLDRDGRQTHVCKVRPARDLRARNEALVMAAMRLDPEVSSLLPPSYYRSVPDLQVLVTAFLPGRPYQHRLRLISAADWLSDMREVLPLSCRFSARAAELIPSLSGHGDPLDLSLQTADEFSYLAGLGIESDKLMTLRRRLEAMAPLRASLQHGDLWPANLLHDRGSWSLLDFEAFGRIKVPLFDAIHLLRTCLEIRTGEQDSPLWLRRVLGPQPDSKACRQLMMEAAQREGVSAEQAVGVLIHYWAVFARRSHLAGNPRGFWEPLLSEVREMARLIAEEPIVVDRLFSGS